MPSITGPNIVVIGGSGWLGSAAVKAACTRASKIVNRAVPVCKAESVYKPDIKGKSDKLTEKTGYT